jgi:hypothetical protein
MNEAEIARLRAALAEAEREREMWERRQDATQGDLEQTGKMLAKAETSAVGGVSARPKQPWFMKERGL